MVGFHRSRRWNVGQQIPNHHSQVPRRKSAENLIIYRDRWSLIASAQAGGAANFHVLMGELPGRVLHGVSQIGERLEEGRTCPGKCGRQRAEVALNGNADKNSLRRASGTAEHRFFWRASGVPRREDSRTDAESPLAR